MPFETQVLRPIRTKSVIGSLVNTLCIFILAAAPAAWSDGENTISIAEARARVDGSKATVTGFVTVAPGTFASATAEQGFAIQSGGAGIYISMAERADVELEERVRVSGILAQMEDLTVLKADPAALEKLGGSQQVEPLPVATGSVGEGVEGRLIKVRGRVSSSVVSDLPYGFKIYIDDGSGEVQLFVHLHGNRPLAEISNVEIGDRLEVVGLGFQYRDTYEVNPRRPGDLKRVQH